MTILPVWSTCVCRIPQACHFLCQLFADSLLSEVPLCTHLKSLHACCSPHRQIWSLACSLACLCVNMVLKTHRHPPTATGVHMLLLHEGEVRRNRWQVGRSGREERKGKERSKICGVNAIVIVDIMRHATNHHRVRARMHGFVFEGVN